jgi:glutaminyl-peptide cyclotransferase
MEKQALHSFPCNCHRAFARVVLLLFLILPVASLLTACGNDEADPRLSFTEQSRDVPDFDAESAYRYIAAQLEFGPRNPGSEGHRLTLDYLTARLRDYAGPKSVYVQRFTHTGYTGETYDMGNVIAAFRPEMGDRIMLLAHWDTRPRAERDPDPRRRSEPIPGADDGGSGVGVLLELARIFRDNPPPVGVDILLFDGEDYGREGDLDYYFLGSRYWSANPPVPGYRPRFGILLDMVGGRDAVFPREGFSMQYAPRVVDEVWRIAGELGYSGIFLDEKGSSIADDHWIINRKTGIPTINIIHHKPPRPMQRDVLFPDYWHTHADDLDIIDKATLQAVGDVLLELVYNRIR